MVNIPSRIDGLPVTVIRNHTFSYCQDLVTIIIPNSVKDIGISAFTGCTNLTKITLPDSITSIKDYTFNNCENLTKITIPDSVTSIGDFAFTNCMELSEIVIPDSIVSIGESALDNTMWYEKQPDGIVYAGKVAYSYKGNMPENTSLILKDGTASISAYAFRDCINLTEITIPDSVITVGINAFDNTEWFNNQPDGVVYAGKVAYLYKGDMPENTSLVLKDGTVSISDSAFNKCTNLTELIIPDSVMSIGRLAFEYCNFTEIKIPDNVKSIKYGLFYGCKNLKKIIIPDSVETIDSYAFYYCTNLTDIILPDSITSIKYNAFSDCSGLEEITIPNSITSIENNTFYDCTNLSEITIPDSVISIGKDAFCNTKWFDNQPDGVVYAGNIAYSYKGDMPENTSLKLKDGTIGVSPYALMECTNLKEVIIPNTVETINVYAFLYCDNLEKVTILNPECEVFRFSIPEEVTIYCYENSTAQTYAEKYGNEFVILSENTLKGDANGDGAIDVADVIAISAYVGDPDANKLDEKNIRNADVHNSGDGLTANDALMIQQYLAKIIKEL